MGNRRFERILDNGWRQGSILSEQLVAAAELPVERTSKHYYLVVSHSCDLTNPKADLEPFVEVLRADVTDSFVKACASARTPRMLALIARDANGVEIDLLTRIETRRFVPRELFITHQPNSDLKLSANSVEMLATWMARRYRRPELPSELINRLGDKIGKLRELGKKYGAIFDRILISLSSGEELLKNQRYQVKFLALLRSGRDSSSSDFTIPQSAKQWATAVDTLLSEGLRGIDVELTEVKSEDEVPLSILREYKTFDLDFISFDVGDFDLTADD
ncbi:MAG: hypothetical protein WB586_13395 [Chthoniobacterales bacterium]